MLAPDDMLVSVQREWNGWRTALVRLGDLEGIHWLHPAGAPARIVHAYVSCSKLVAGSIPHECSLTTAPHRLLVCIIKRHTAAAVYEEMANRADAVATGGGVFALGPACHSAAVFRTR